MELIKIQRTFSISHLALIFITAVLGAIASFIHWLVFGIFLVLILVLILVSIKVGRFTLWQKLAFLALSGYVILSYGFANLVFRVGSITVPVGHLLLFTALLLAVPKRAHDVKAFLKEPVALCWLLLLFISFIHFLIDVPKFGAYAIRDASFVTEGVFLLLGFLWAKREIHANFFLKSLTVLFLLNFAYSLTFPVGEVLTAHSPVSGVFLEVPLLGFYSHMPLFLVSGALLYFLVAKKITKWPYFILLALAFIQVGWSLVFQARAMYVGIIVALLLLILFSSIGKWIKVVGGVVIGIISFLIVVSSFDIEIPGRIGPVESDFLIQHFRSILLEPGTPAEGSVIWRLELLPEVWDRWTASTSTIIVGEGFGKPLTDFALAGGVAVRQPHNTHLTVLVRLGLAGFTIWVFMHWRILSVFMRNLRRCPRESSDHDVILWFFLFYVLAMIFTTVQPWLEFSYGAIPFFMLVGFALGFLL